MEFTDDLAGGWWKREVNSTALRAGWAGRHSSPVCPYWRVFLLPVGRS